MGDPLAEFQKRCEQISRRLGYDGYITQAALLEAAKDLVREEQKRWEDEFLAEWESARGGPLFDPDFINHAVERFNQQYDKIFFEAFPR